MPKSSIRHPKLIESAKEKFGSPIFGRVAILENPFRLSNLWPVSKVILNDSCNYRRLGPGQGEADKPQNREKRDVNAHCNEKCLHQRHLLADPFLYGGDPSLWRS